jgi:hypothetical protein
MKHQIGNPITAARAQTTPFLANLGRSSPTLATSILIEENLSWIKSHLTCGNRASALP